MVALCYQIMYVGVGGKNVQQQQNFVTLSVRVKYTHFGALFSRPSAFAPSVSLISFDIPPDIRGYMTYEVNIGMDCYKQYTVPV